MLALDHRGSFKKMINPNDPQLVTDEDIISLKGQIIQYLQNQFSGVLVDIEWGLKAYPNRVKPFLLPVEESGFSEKDGERINNLQCSVSEIQQLGAKGVKLLIYFNPHAKSALEQINLARSVLNESIKYNLPLFLEIVTYQIGSSMDFKNDGRSDELVLQSVKMFLDQKVIPDVFKLEYPGSQENSAQITTLLGKIPWILLTRGDEYKTFVDELKAAKNGGAAGFLAGRALWQEVFKLSGAEKEKFLAEILPQRFKEISEIMINPNS